MREGAYVHGDQAGPNLIADWQRYIEDRLNTKELKYSLEFKYLREMIVELRERVRKLES